MNLLFGICIILGILCLCYFGIITIYAGIGTAFAWFWICAGIGFIILGIVVRIVIKNDIKIPDLVKIFVIAIVSVGLCAFILLEGLLIYNSSREATPNCDYLIVLGAQVRGTTITKALKKRLDTALDYLEDNPNTVVIVSGGKGAGENISEAEAMRLYLISKGIKKDRIMEESKSTSTDENIRYSKLLMKDENASVAVVTNGFHIFRSVSLAKKQGLTGAQGLAAPSDKILLVNYYVREAAGVIKDWLFGNI